MRGLALLAVMLGSISVPLLAQSVAPPPPAGANVSDPTDALSDFLGLGEASERMTVPVSIGTNGPYHFIIDTGAERTVVSRELAGMLKLTAGRRVKVTTMSGAGELGTFLLPELRISRIAPAPIEAPAVEARNLGAIGMLGIDALKGHAVSIDFDKQVMEVRPSKKRSFVVGPDEIVIRAKNLYGQLIVTDARYRGRRISVVIDTGSPVTIGNLALLKRVRTEKSLGMISLMSVTGQSISADYRVIDQLSIAGIGFSQVPIAFADGLPFKRFGLIDTPALMLGMDSLKLFRRVQIDFANREIRFTLPRDAILGRPTF
ncbi:MAG: aspartyl protease family protein [Pseudomonadota bacterium]